jgi:uncharacterized membrane protein
MSSTATFDRRPFFVLGTLGLALSLVLELFHVRAYLTPTASAFCALGEQLDCTSVALSRFSVILGVPVPLWGALGFIAILVATVRRSRWLLVLSGAAALVSLALLVVEVVAIGALCLLCEAVHLVSFLLFWLAWRRRDGLSSSFSNRDDVVLVFAPPAGLFIALLFFVPRYYGIFGWKGDLPFSHGKTEDGFPWIGAASPALVVQEFTDYSCPHCRVASARTLKHLADHPRSLRVVRRQYPRGRCHAGRETICLAVRIAYCAEEQGKFWQADRWLFEHEAESVRNTPANIAKDVGLDAEKLRACIGRKDIYDRAVAEAEAALRKRFPGTPYYIVGQRRMPESELAKLVRDLDR